jgi:hypothetical protein
MKNRGLQGIVRWSPGGLAWRIAHIKSSDPIRMRGIVEAGGEEPPAIRLADISLGIFRN